MVRRVKKMVPAWDSPARSASSPLSRGARQGHLDADPSVPTTLPCCNIRAERPAFRKAPRHCMEDGRQHVGVRTWVHPFLDEPRRGQMTSSWRCRSIISSPWSCALFGCGGAANILITNPRDSGHDQAPRSRTASTSFLASTRFQRAPEQPGFASSIFPSRGDIGGGMAVQRASPNAGRRSPATRDRSLWADRNLAAGVRPIRSTCALQRRDRHADADRRHRHPRRRRRRRCRSARRAKSACAGRR